MLQGSNRAERIRTAYLANVAAEEEREAISVALKRVRLSPGEEVPRSAFAFLIVNFLFKQLDLALISAAVASEWRLLEADRFIMRKARSMLWLQIIGTGRQ
jgi:hypothetical protein